MANKKPTDYQEPSKDVPAPIEEPPADHLQPEEEVAFPAEKRLWGVFKYMGDTYRTIDYYGVAFERGAWVEVHDPFIAKSCRGNTDFDTKGKDAENEDKQKRRDQREIDRETYIRQQENKRSRANKNADAVMGRD